MTTGPSRVLFAMIVATALYTTTALARTSRGDSVLQPAQAPVLLMGSEGEGARTAIGAGLYSQDFHFSDGSRSVGDVSMTGLWSARYITFVVPDSWEVQARPVLNLDVMRSEQLIPEISSITVWLDQQPIGTFKLDGQPGEVKRQILQIPLPLTPGRHTLQFNAYHRSWIPCELADHPGLWSRLMASSYLQVQYREIPPELDLSRWPYPFVDDLDPNPSKVVVVLPENPSADDLRTAGYISSLLGRSLDDRRMDLVFHRGSLEDAPEGNVIIVGRAEKSGIDRYLPLLSDPAYQGLNNAIKSRAFPGVGGLALVPRPGRPNNVVLVVAGRDGAGLVALGQLLSGDQSRRLPSAKTELVGTMDGPSEMESRRWEDTFSDGQTFTFDELGYSDLTVSGFRGGAITIPLRRIPDEIPIVGKAKLHLVYSYDAQASSGNSRLDVLLNGSGAGGKALDQTDGGTRVVLDTELPVFTLGPEGSLQIRFDLIGKEEPICLGDTHSELRGTVHAESSITLPRQLVGRINDLGNLQHGFYPFGIAPDFAHTLIVLPAVPDDAAIQVYLWLTAQMGAYGRGDRYAYEVRLGKLLESDQEVDIIAVDAGKGGELVSSAVGLSDSMWMSTSTAMGTELLAGAKVSFAANPLVSWLELMERPDHLGRSALVVRVNDVGTYERVGSSPEGLPLIESLGGRVSRVAGLTSVAQVAGPPPAKPQVAEQAQPKPSPWGLLLLIATGVLLLLLLFALYLRNRSLNEKKARGNRDDL